MEIFSLLAKLTLDDKDFNTALDSAETKAEGFAGSVGGFFQGIKDGLTESNIPQLVTKIGGALKKQLDKTLDYADAVDKGSQRIGITAKAYQELDYALSMSGASVNDLSIGITKLKSIMTGNAAKGITEAFEKLGVDTVDANGNIRETSDVLNDVLMKLSSMKQSAERDNIVDMLFGAGKGKALNAFLNEGEAGIKKLYKEAEDYGLVMSDESIKQAVQTQDAMDRLEKTINGLMMNILTPALPLIETICNVLSLIGPLFKGISDGITDLVNGLGFGEKPDMQAVDDLKAMIEEADQPLEDAKAGLEKVDGVSTDAADKLSGLTKAASSASAALFEIGNEKGSGTHHTGSGGGFASGLWSVPYDGYRAVLHRDEIVLNKSRADDYRSGSDTDSGAVVAAIQRLDTTLANLRLEVNGKLFGRAAVDYGGQRMNNYIGGAENRLAAGYGS